jgi:hypothetical protein
MVWTCKENDRKQTATQNVRMGTRGKAKKGKTQREMDRWIDGVRRSMTNHGLTEEDTRDRDSWRNIVLGEGKPLYSGQTLDDDDDYLN